MHYDDILFQIDEFGLYQKVIFLLVTVCTLFAPLNVVSQAFLAGNPDHWCDVEAWRDCSCSDESLNTSEVSLCNELKRNLSIPWTDQNGFDECHKYDLPKEWIDNCSVIVEVQVFNASSQVPCDEGWIYDTTQTSITSDFDLVCDRQSLPDIAQSVYFCGILLGSAFYGTLSDRLGRRASLFISTTTTAVFGILVSVSPSFVVYVITRFFLGASAHNTFLTGFVLVSEIAGPSKRVFTGLFYQFAFAIGIIILPGIAVFTNNWRVLQLIITLPGFLTLALLPVVPESPRWLISKHRNDEAMKIVRKTAKWNGKNLSEDAFQKMMESEETKDNVDEDTSVVRLFSAPSLRYRTFNLVYNWFVQSFVYFGLTLSTESLGINLYLGYFISGLVEMAGYTIAIFLIERFGRKLSLCGLMIVVSSACFLLIVLPEGIARIIIGMIGKCAISATFGIIFVYTAELYPTPLRGVAVGICAISARIGGMICPLVFILSTIWMPLPLVLFTAVSILAAILSIFLPETKGLRLPETIEEAESLGRKHERIPTADVSGVS